MKLRNKKTGEVVDLIEIVRLDDVSNEFYLRLSDNEGRTFKVGFNSLAELNNEWEDYEEPKEVWFIECDGEVYNIERLIGFDLSKLKEIGNYFETEEEAEKAVEKLKAWKRLKDKGFEFDNFIRDVIYYKLSDEEIEKDDVIEDLELLFGGEE